MPRKDDSRSSLFLQGLLKEASNLNVLVIVLKRDISGTGNTKWCHTLLSSIYLLHVLFFSNYSTNINSLDRFAYQPSTTMQMLVLTGKRTFKAALMPLTNIRPVKLSILFASYAVPLVRWKLQLLPKIHLVKLNPSK